MRQQRYGRIINFASESGLWGNAGQANYGAAKSAIAGLSRVVARDMGRYGVTSNVIAPRAMTRLIATIPGREGNPDTGGMPQMEPEHRSDGRIPGFGRSAERERAAVPRVRRDCSGAAPPGAWKTLFKEGTWTLDELSAQVPSLMEGTRNPAPPP